jgi:hypothetical protein
MTLLGIALAAEAIALQGRSTPDPAHNTACYSQAAKAASNAFSIYYRADWHITLSGIVQRNHVRSIEVRLGPYDGSAGGGIVARYDCATGKLKLVEYER